MNIDTKIRFNMNTKWETVDVTRYTNGDHYNFCKNILVKAKLCPAIVENCAAILADYEAKLREEDEVLVLSQKVPHSQQMREQDDLRDRRYYNITETVRAMAKYPFPEVVAAAGRVQECLTLYKLNPQANINKETGVMDNLLQELQGPLAADVETLRLTEIVTLMAAANAETNRLYTERFVANANKVNERMAKAREGVDKCYQQLREKVNALVVVFGAEQYSDFIGFANQYIIDLKRRALKQTAKNPTAGAGDNATTENGSGDSTNEGGENNENNNNNGNENPGGSIPTNPQPGTDDDPDL